MLGKFKCLRHDGKRLSDRDIGAVPAIEGDVRVYGVGTAIVANVTDPSSQIADPLVPTLYEARLTTMNSAGLLLKGEEWPQGDAGPA
jgi:hypothetical protein